MASNINETGVNTEYPRAGEDNDSQGFRDNFSVISSNFVAAKSEIESLQTNSAKLNAGNDFLGNDVSGANLIANTTKLYAGGTITGPQNVSFTNGNYQTFTIGASLTLTFADWPTANKVGKIRLVLLDTLGDSTTRTVTWATSGGGTIKTGPGWPSPFVVESNVNPVVVDFWTSDGGTTVYAEYVGVFT